MRNSTALLKMEAIMKKYTGVLLTGLCTIFGSFRDTQAMGGARDFAKRVLFSGTAAAATGAGLFDHYRRQVVRDKALAAFEAAECTLPSPLEGKVKKIFKDVGVDVIIKDNECGPAVFQHKGKVFLILSRADRSALECDRGYIFRNYADGFVTGADVVSTLKHERVHILHEDYKKDVAKCSVIPGGIMLAKMARVAGRSKKGALAAGLATVVLGKVLVQRHNQYIEKRADYEGVEVWEDAENIAHYLEVAFLPSEKKCTETFHDKWFNKIFSSHPQPSERIAYLKERAYVLRAQEMEKLVFDLDAMSSAAHYNLGTMQERDFEPFVKKILRIQDIKKSMNDEEKKHWRDIFLKNSTDPICLLIQRDFL